MMPTREQREAWARTVDEITEPEHTMPELAEWLRSGALSDAIALSEAVAWAKAHDVHIEHHEVTSFEWAWTATMARSETMSPYRGQPPFDVLESSGATLPEAVAALKAKIEEGS